MSQVLITKPPLILALDTAGDRIACAVGELLSIADEYSELSHTEQNTDFKVDSKLNAFAPSHADDGSPELQSGATSTTDTPSLATIRLLASVEETARRQANVRLLSVIEQIFNQHGLDKGQIRAVVCGRGPGSFTGVRIAIASAKGLALGLGVPLYGVSSLDAIAWAAWEQGLRGRLGVVADAMRGEVYPARFDLTPSAARRLDAHSVCKAQSLATDWLAESPDAPSPFSSRSDHGPAASSGSSKAESRCQRRSEQRTVGERKTPQPLLAGDALYKYSDLFASFKLLPQSLWAVSGFGLLLAFADQLSPDILDKLRHPPAVASLSSALPSTLAAAKDTAASLSPNAQSNLPEARDANIILSPTTPAAFPEPGDAATLLPIYTRLADAEENERLRLRGQGELTQGALLPTPKSGVADPSGLGRPVLRPAASVDIPAMTALEEKLFANPLIVLSGECWTEGMFAADLKKDCSSWWVCYLGNELTGFAGGRVLDGEFHLQDLAVDKCYRRRGIARLLLGKLAADARVLGAETCTLEARASNREALGLYSSLGLSELGKRKRYYAPKTAEDPREDAIVMSGNIDRLIASADQPAPLEVAESALSVCCNVDSGEQPPKRHGNQLVDVVDALDSPHCVDKVALSLFQPTAATAGSSTNRRVDQAATFSPDALVHPLILAIESSCDDTAAALIDGRGRILANLVSSQDDFHQRFGGIVPEIAARKHTESIVSVAGTVSEQIGWQQLDAVAVTYAPGLIGALVVGMAFAKGLSWARDLPLIRVNHLEGHIYALRFADSPPEPPFVIALLSGGNTMLVHVKSWGEYRVLGATLDDAVGEAYDKVAKALGLGYPGGPIIAKLAAEGNPQAIDFPRALLHSGDLSFSLSGLKTAVLTYISQQQSDQELKFADIAASFEAAIIDVQVAKAQAACAQVGARTFCLGGGVAANTALRQAYRRALEPATIKVVFPPPLACTDNAAMIAAVALDRYRQGKFAPLSSDAQARADLEQPY